MNEMIQHQQQQQLMNMNPNMMSMNQQMNPQPQMIPMNRSYGAWGPPPQFPNTNPGAAMKPPPSAFNKSSLGPRNNWKGKKMNKGNDIRRKNLPKSVMAAGGGFNNNNNYQPPNLNELQHQNRLRTRKFFPKKFNKNNNGVNMNNNNKYYNNCRTAPFAPRNTTSFIIRAKKSGGIAALVSPSPMTPAVLPTPIFSPSKEVLVDMAKEEWGVDGYGSMKGLIRLRSSSPGHEMELLNEDYEEDEGGSSDSDVEEHVEVERRLEHDLSRFEMVCNPNSVCVGGGVDYQNVLENRVDDQDSHIAQLEEENLILKERLFLMEREFGDLRRRMQFLESKENGDLENESGGEEAHSMEDNNGDYSVGKSDDGGDNNGEGFEAEKIVGLVESDKNGDVMTRVDGKEEYNDDKFTNGNESVENDEIVVEDVKENSNVDIGSSEHVITVAQDICMEEDNVVSEKDVANSG